MTIEFTTDPNAVIVPGLPDPIEIARRFEIYRKACEDLAESARSLNVRDDPAKVLATEIGTSAARLVKKIRKTENDLVEEPKAYLSTVRNLVKPFYGILDEAKRIAASKISDYEAAEELRREEEETRKRREREDLQEALDEEALRKGLDPVSLPDVVEPKTEKVTRSVSGSAHAARRWTFEIVDLDKVPDEYIEPRRVDSRAINSAIGRGIREIPGLRIFQQRDTRFRT